jgi:CPA1 family monovalent cation:H+ antiporter
LDIGVERITRDLTWLLIGASVLGMLADRLRIPYAASLVLAGVLVAESGLVSVPQLEPSLVLLVFLPPLLFDAAFRLDSRELGGLVRPLLLLALPGTVLTAFVVGGILALALGLPLSVALLFGGVVAATDPVAVVSVFRRMHVAPRLTVVIEAESLLNDGVAIALYGALLGLAVSGTARVDESALLFLWRMLAGIALGAGFGFVFSHLTRLTDDHLTEMMLSTALAYGSYLAVEALGASGPLACVAAGVVHGSYGRAIGMSPLTRQRLDDLWEYVGFFANGLLFLLLGFTVNLASLRAQAWPVAVAIAAVLLARVLLIGLSTLLPPDQQPGTSVGERIVLVWGGLRGALTVTLALALPADTPGRELVTTLALGTVLFSLVVQGLTLPWVIRRLGLSLDRAPGKASSGSGADATMARR